MAKRLLLSAIGAATTLFVCAVGAAASPGAFGGIGQTSHQGADGVTLARMRSMGMGHAMMGRRFSHFSGPRFRAHNFRHHRHNRFFFVGDVPYYDYNNYYDSSCWWSRRYHHWVCPNY